MKHLLLVLALFLFVSPALAGENTKWQFSTFSFSGTKPSNRVWVIKYRWSPTTAPDPVFTRVLSGGQWGSSVVTNQLVTGQTSTGTSTADSVWLEVGHSLTTSFTPMMWIQCNRFGDGTPQKSGPIVDGVRVDGNGNPVDNNGNPIEPEEPPPERYKVNLTYTNSNAFPVSLLVMLNKVSGGFVGSYGPFNAYPGETWSETYYYSEPFTGTVNVNRDGYPLETLDPVESVPTDEDDPPKPADGEPGGDNGPPASGGGGVTPGDSQIPGQPPVSDEERPGDSEGNEESRHKELRKELQRIAEQMRAVGNQAAKDADMTNGKLAEISDKLGKPSDADGSTGNNPNPQIPGKDEADDLADDLTTALTDTKQAMAGVKDSMLGMIAAAGLNQEFGSESWDFSLPLGPFGTFQVSFADWQWVFDLLRQVTLAMLSMHFLGVYLRTIRGAFV